MALSLPSLRHPSSTTRVSNERSSLTKPQTQRARDQEPEMTYQVSSSRAPTKAVSAGQTFSMASRFQVCSQQELVGKPLAGRGLEVQVWDPRTNCRGQPTRTLTSQEPAVVVNFPVGWHPEQEGMNPTWRRPTMAMRIPCAKIDESVARCRGGKGLLPTTTRCMSKLREQMRKQLAAKKTLVIPWSRGEAKLTLGPSLLSTPASSPTTRHLEH